MPSIVEILLDRSKADTELLRKNDKLGDVFTIPREVDFLLRTPSEKKAKGVAGFINDNQYGRASVQSVEAEFRIQVLIEMPITQNVVCSVSALMACISKIFGVNYDGWGCVIQSRA